MFLWITMLKLAETNKLSNMKYKIQETIFGTFRVLWKADDGIRAGHQDFDTINQAKDFVVKIRKEIFTTAL